MYLVYSLWDIVRRLDGRITRHAMRNSWTHHAAKRQAIVTAGESPHELVNLM
jgi:hypothetical protein